MHVRTPIFNLRVTSRIGCAASMAPIRLRHPVPYAADHYRSGVTAKYLQRQFEMMLLVLGLPR
jgi:hypothetical protein